ncbi:hypothetical protein EXIGLDRAFT_836450 [Exidia glandulosa HHB12029]|uniref:BTB domain-containing protein n=1 Tax=Exidia glandulosa HHB12029 TaxID=1314781 RepID=A0A165HTN4_EXIGL|nr:hypothetical protein EXIGLDRAFT_836450 [Exidia glandulosa HHB12029]
MAQQGNMPSHSTSVHEATNNFSYDDSVVRIRAGNRVYKVSRSRLTQRSPVFQDIFRVAVRDGQDVDVEVQDDSRDFEDFLWFLHADGLDVAKFNETPYSSAYLRRWFSVASVAYKYQMDAVAEWSLNLFMRSLEDIVTTRTFGIVDVVQSTLSIPSLWGADAPQSVRGRMLARTALYKRAHRGANWMKNDIADVLVILESIRELELLAHAYYYLVVYRPRSWITDDRIRPIDRQRMLCGCHELSLRGFAVLSLPEDSDASRHQDRFLEQQGSDLWNLFDVEQHIPDARPVAV